MTLDDLRGQLDQIDQQMLALLAQRAGVVLEVADLKKRLDLPVHVPEREAAIVERLRALNPGPIDGDAVERIYRTIVEEMRNFESRHIMR